MDSFTLEKLEFDRLRQILQRYCRCSLGASLAKRIAPSNRPATVRRRLAETGEMVAAVTSVGPPPYGGITDIRAALGRAVPGGGVTGEDFAAIAATLEGCGAVRQWLSGLGEGTDHLAEVGREVHAFDGEVRAIHAIVDQRGDVRDTASDRLASIRREMDSCQDRIRHTVYAFVKRKDVAQYLQSTTVQMHEDRYVLPLKAAQRGRLPGVVHRWSHTGATLFVEPAECVQLNNRLVDLHDKERSEIARLLGELAIRVHSRAEQIRQSLRALGRIDLITAKAQYAYEFDMVGPQMTERSAVQLHQARHPLLIEQVYQQQAAGADSEQLPPVVPIDVRLGADFDVLIVTGSNTGGKTVALKTVGLLAAMAQSGLHIPTQRGATLPVFGDILLDVGDEQSLQQSLSTFGGHLQRIRHVLRRAKRNSLVLLDELGSGTDPDEGGAIGQAILDQIRRIGCVAMVSTHLGVLKAYAYAHDRVDNASVEFDTDTLSPTYRLLIGQPGESHAIVVAEHYGLPARVIRAARHHLPRQHKRLREAIRATTASRKASEEARSAAAEAEAAAVTQQEQYKKRFTDLDRLAKEFSDWVSSLPALKAGDEVFVRKLNKSGRLERLQLSRQVAVVNVDNLQVEVPLQELMPDLGDGSVREEITSLRRQIADQSRRTETALAAAQASETEAKRSLAKLRQRERSFEAWLARLKRLAIGEEVTFSQPPGFGTVIAMDLPAGKVTVRIKGKPKGSSSDGKMDLRIQELFPETSDPAAAAAARRGQSRRRGEADSRPVVHRDPKSRRARQTGKKVLELPIGSEVYVVPFRKRARLLAVDAAKQQVKVQTGAFELQVALADVEPIAERPPARPTKPTSSKPEEDPPQ